MKEAIGGTWLFGIVIAFIALFTCFVSLTTNYSRSFKIKDEILMTIEHYHGINDKTITRINKYLTGIGYSTTDNCPDDGQCWIGFSVKNGKVSTGYAKNVNYCLAKHPSIVADEHNVTNGPIGHPESAYYSAAVFFKLDWPIFRNFVNLKITGETSVIHLPIDYPEVDKKCGGTR